jgi:hypothetical protein
MTDLRAGSMVAPYDSGNTVLFSLAAMLSGLVVRVHRFMVCVPQRVVEHLRLRGLIL